MKDFFLRKAALLVWLLTAWTSAMAQDGDNTEAYGMISPLASGWKPCPLATVVSAA